MSNAGIAFLAGLLHGGLDQYKTNRKWKQEDELRQAFMDAVNDGGGDQGAQAAPAQGGSSRQSILQEFGAGQQQAPQQPQQQQQFSNPSASVGNYGVDTGIPSPELYQKIAQAARPQAAPQTATAQATATPVAQSTLTPTALPPVSSMIAQSEPSAIAGVQAARDAMAMEDASAPAPTVAEQVARSAATLGGSGSGVAGQGIGDLMKGAESRGRKEDDQLKKFAIAAALKGDLHSALQITQEVKNRQYARDDLKYAVGVANDPTGEDARKLVKMIGGAGIPGTTVVTDPDTGIATLQLQQPDGSTKDISLKGSTMMRTAVAYRKAQRGDPSALADLAAVDKDFASQALAGWQFNTHLTQLNNSAANIKSNIGYRDQRAAAEDRRYGQQERRLDVQQQKMDSKDAQDAERRAAAAELVKDPTNPALRARYAAAGGTDFQHFMDSAGGNAPMESKLADVFLQAGLAKDKATALRMALQRKDDSPDKIRTQIYLKQLELEGDSKKAMERTNESMKLLFPDVGASAEETAAAGTGVQPGALKVGQVVAGKDGKQFAFMGGDSRDPKNWREVAGQIARR